MNTQIDLIFKEFQSNIAKEKTYEYGKQKLLELRQELSRIQEDIFAHKDAFARMPLRTDKTIAYYIYHLTRIEDITANTLIDGNQQRFFKSGYDRFLNSPIITTGNELGREELEKFSQQLNLEQLYEYAKEVRANTDEIIRRIDYAQSKTRVTEQARKELVESKTVSQNDNAIWLVDYWCKKTYCGLMLMPFSRHYMLHLCGCERIIRKLK